MMSSREFFLKAVACVKAASFVAQATNPELPHDQAPVVKNLGNGLCVVYLVDTGEQFVYVQNSHLAAVQANAATLHEIGLQNLGELNAGKIKLEQYGGFQAVRLDKQFEASLILLDHVWDETLSSHTPNGCVVALPSRDVLSFCDADSEEGIQDLKTLAQRVTQSGAPHLLTTQLYQRKNQAWIAFN